MLRKNFVLGAIASFLSFAATVLGDNVHALTPDTFDGVLGSKPALVEFYAPWCGHCKNLAPVYDQLGDAFSTKKDQVIIAKVDADEHKALGGRYGVQGFPTIKWFPNGVASAPEDYSGGRDLESLTEFVTKKSGVRSSHKKVISAVEVLTDSNFEEKVKKSGKHYLVEFYAPWCGHCKNLAPTYEKVAADFLKEKDITIAKVDATTETRVAEEYGVTGYPTIKYFSKDGTVSEYEGGRQEDDFLNFINNKVGTQRAAGGLLRSEVGRNVKLDEIAVKFTKATDPEERRILSEQGANLAAHLMDSDKNARHYGRIFQKALDTPDFALNESARLSKLIKSGTVSSNQLDDLVIRQNILTSFHATPAAAKEEL
ncbi:protein disulfide-isomerase A6 [Entomortierella parvispora]|uniref:protein disulfide-isomerase n=1 Tax=Entomortierella parvispora TaxID=205924 RepID=A0A9P3HFZ4_9FUNG|nr:protein disulfide-isomerase A6 [Entomortierella parvispora]